jgi:hypothetical protein
MDYRNYTDISVNKENVNTHNNGLYGRVIKRMVHSDGMTKSSS